MTLREKLEQLSNEELEVLMQEYIDWETPSKASESETLWKTAIEYIEDDENIDAAMERVAYEVFRVYALRAAGMR